ncbi:MAG: serine hydrolase, partial [Gemmatimonadaceae bacterium]
AGDLVRFGDALRAGKLLSQQWLDSLWTARVAMPQMPTPASYGYGFMVRQTPLGRQAGHTGGSPGVSSSYDLYIDKGYGVAVLTNQDPVGLRLALRKITAGLRGLELATEGR